MSSGQTSSSDRNTEAQRGSTRWSAYLTAANTVLIFVILIVSVQSGSDTSDPDDLASGAQGQLDAALGLARERIEADDLPGAYDYLLAAMRLGPEDARTFEAIIGFIERAGSSADPNASGLALDLHARADVLVTYQAPADIATARARWTATDQALARRLPATNDPFTSVDDAITAAGRANLPFDVRLALHDAAERELEALRIDLALADPGPVAVDIGPDTGPPDMIGGAPTGPDIWAQLADREQRLAELALTLDRISFVEISASALDWTETAESALKAASEPIADNDRVPAMAEGLRELAMQGADYAARLDPFVGAEFATALEVQQQVQDTATDLMRGRQWLYNQQALERIKFVVDEKSDFDAIERVKLLLEIDPANLSSYVLERFENQWRTVLDECDDEQKVQAVKLRILQRALQ